MRSSAKAPAYSSLMQQLCTLWCACCDMQATHCSAACFWGFMDALSSGRHAASQQCLLGYVEELRYGSVSQCGARPRCVCSQPTDERSLSRGDRRARDLVRLGVLSVGVQGPDCRQVQVAQGRATCQQNVPCILPCLQRAWLWLSFLSDCLLVWTFCRRCKARPQLLWRTRRARCSHPKLGAPSVAKRHPGLLSVQLTGTL